VLLPPLVVALFKLALLQVILRVVIISHSTRADMTRGRQLPPQVLRQPIKIHSLLLLLLVVSEDGGCHQDFNGRVLIIVGRKAVLDLFHWQGMSVEGIYIHAILE
jgi:hypothetical protein